MANEVRVTSASGAQKGTKDERYDLIPSGPLSEIARLYGAGARKYADNNWRKGYALSLSYAALQRHANQFWSGEDIDEETQASHLASVAWHAIAMLENLKARPELDDRFKGARMNYDGQGIPADYAPAEPAEEESDAEGFGTMIFDVIFDRFGDTDDVWKDCPDLDSRKDYIKKKLSIIGLVN